MNKHIIAFMVLLGGFSVVAMELTTITEQENKNFSRHLSMALGFSKKVVTENQVPAYNPIYVMLNRLNDDLVINNGEISKVITSVKGLNARIAKFKKVDSNPLIQFGLQQIREGSGDVKEAQAYVTRTRIVLTGLKLQKWQPAYCNQWIGEVQTNDRIGFMLRNENYPLNDKAMKDYIATFIYQLLFAPKI